MIPVFEFESWFVIVGLFLFLLLRVYKCTQKYDRIFLRDLLIFGIISSMIWIVFGYKYKIKTLVYQFVILIAIYVCLILYLHHKLL